jgi:hypothetical protein
LVQKRDEQEIKKTYFFQKDGHFGERICSEIHVNTDCAKKRGQSDHDHVQTEINALLNQIKRMFK